MADFAELEAQDGIRFSWNIWPSNKIEATKCVVPFGAFYQLLKPLENMPVLPYEPLRCKGCMAVLNPFSRVDFHGKMWVCPFCYTRNHFPQHYAGISEQNQPAELFPQYTTVEYKLNRPPAPPPAFLLVVDTCIIEEELSAIKASLTQALSLVPENALVGLITFGTHVQVHELGFAECSKSWIFRGNKDVTPLKVIEHLALRKNPQAQQHPQQQQRGGVGRFLLPVADCEFQLTAVLDELQKDAFPVQPDERPGRCTGTALAVAAGLLSGSCAGQGGRIILLTGGPCTEGAGAVVGKSNEEAMRSHKDLEKDSAPHFRKACKYYESVAAQLVSQNHTLDVFACALDQCGLAEMKVCVERTSGHMILAESFNHEVFKKSFQRLFTFTDTESSRAMGTAFNGLFEVYTSRDVKGNVKVSGALGPAASAEKRTSSVSDISVGMGNTCAWKLPGLDESTTMAVFFDIASKDAGSGAGQAPGMQFYVQFVTTYEALNGETRMRVSTCTRRWAESNSPAELIPGFDQEAAAVLVARLCTYKMETEDEYDATRWLDRMLIRLASRFGEYQKDVPDSFQLSPTFSIFPQFMFNLRRSQFVQVFGNSPDETVYFRSVLHRESVLNSLVMIQPTLLSYSFNGPPEPALLDVSAMSPDKILLLDAYFSVVVFHGSTIAQWRKAKYQEQEEHEAFKLLLEAPQQEADVIMQERFPVPRFVDCDQHGSQARFLLAKLNPSATYQSNGVSGDVIFTDDVSLQVFMEHLKRLSVQSS